MSPCALIVGTNLSYQQHCRCLFGSYVQTHKETDNNTDKVRTLDAICLGPTGNSQGTYKFLNLSTGKQIHRRKWTELPVPDWVIKRVNELGRCDKMEKIWVSKNRSKIPIDDDATQDENLFNEHGDRDTPDNDDHYDDEIITENVTKEAQN